MNQAKITYLTKLKPMPMSKSKKAPRVLLHPNKSQYSSVLLVILLDG